ncbi:MAG TPA: U32 family peptidase [Syntrophomonadaceae bacterium]|nr:U32 family peptidase [Syntrophomonadaceae bacterium]HNX27863.1 U32 family peptidase [Syntrophomonadaceae bacterium]HPR93139.1 U32 family peptidase [Syntrophomonadaceae bacterium]
MLQPELLLPAGDGEKLKTALLFGADSVYIGGKDFSLRAYAGNFTMGEIKAGLDFARSLQKKVVIAVNVMAHNKDLTEIPAYLEKLASLDVDGFIISDLGVLRQAQKYAPRIPITISTQANVTNYETAAFYQELGAKRIVLARELNIDEIADIKQKTGIEIEVFVHGAMCVSYSGRCLLSHYMTGRSANLGACAHPCRYRYALVEEKRPGEYYPLDEDSQGSYILNSRDLCLLEYIPRLIDAGVDAFKVEGRMKSPLYIAGAASVYRAAIDHYLKSGQDYTPWQLHTWMEELRRSATRPFTNGFIEGESKLIQDIDNEKMPGRDLFCGIVKSYQPDIMMAVIEQRANFGAGEQLEFLLPDGKVVAVNLEHLYDQELNEIDRARHPQQMVLIPLQQEIAPYSILRRREKANSD